MGTYTPLVLLVLCVAIAAARSPPRHLKPKIMDRGWRPMRYHRPKKIYYHHRHHRRCGIAYRSGSIFFLRQFRGLRKCPKGTRPVGRSLRCRIVHLSAFMQWVRKNGRKHGYTFGGIRLYRIRHPRPVKRPRIVFYLGRKRHVFRPRSIYRPRLFRWRRNKKFRFGRCLPGSRRHGRGYCKIFNFRHFRHWIIRHGRRSFHLTFVRFKFGRFLRRNFRPGGYVKLQWFHRLKHCMWGTKRAGRRCKIVHFTAYRNWLRRYGPRYGITHRRFRWIRGYKFRYYKLLRRNFHKGGYFNMRWFRGLRRCMRGTKRIGRKCRIVNIRRVIRWIRRHAWRYHINPRWLPRVPTSLHLFLFNGRPSRRWPIRRKGGVRYVKRKYMYFPGTKHSGATFRRIPFRGSFSISFYMKPSRVNGRQTLIGSWVPRKWLYKLHLVNGKLGLWLRSPRQPINVAAVYGGHLVPNRWYHVGFTWNTRSRFLSLYVNGKRVGRTKGHGNKIFPHPGRTALGFKQDSHNENYKGYIAGLRISRGVVPRRRFVILSRLIKNFKLRFGGFKYLKQLRRNIRRGGVIWLKWFNRGKHRRRRCPRGTRFFGRRRRRCRVIRPNRFYNWLRKHGPRYRININKIRRPRYYHFAPGNRRMALYRGLHSLGGRLIKGHFNSRRCRDWCARNKRCRSVDFNGQNRRCFYHTVPKKRYRTSYKIAQYYKRHRRPRPQRWRRRGFTHRYGDCVGHDIKHYSRTNLRFCTKQCRRRRNCHTFLFIDRGSKSKCWLKNKWCRRLTGTRRRNYHFYTKKRTRIFMFWKQLRRNFRKGGVIRLRWFRRKKCMHGTKRIGKSRRCRIVHIRYFRRWIRRVARTFRIPVHRFPHYGSFYHLYLFRGPSRNRRWRIRRRGGVKFHRFKTLPSLYFPGKRGAYAVGGRFPKSRRSFTIGLYIRTPSVKRRQTLIGQWAPKRWQYLFRIWNGGQLGLYLRRNKYNSGSDPRQDMVPGFRGGRVKPNRWTFVGFSWDHYRGIARIYQNGRIVATRKTKYKNHNLFHRPWPKFQLGYKKDSNNENFRGYIAGLGFYRGLLPLRRFKQLAKRISTNVPHFGGFKFIKKLQKALRIRGVINLKWFRHGKKIPRRCPRGSYHRGRALWDRYVCHIRNLHHVWRWIRRNALRYRINLTKLRKPRFHRFAPSHGRMRLYPHRHSLHGKPLPGRRTSKWCRNYCHRHWHCKAVDYNAHNRRCYVHTTYRRIVPGRWFEAQYRKVGPNPSRKHIRNYGHRYGDCRDNNIRKMSGVSRYQCARQCNKRRNCKSFIWVNRGPHSYCWLKRSYCRHLTHRNNKKYHFYTKRIRRFKWGKLLRKQLRKNGIINLKWFRGLRRCMRGTKRIGKSSNCKVIRKWRVIRWIRRQHRRWHFNLSHFPMVPRLYHLYPLNGRRPHRRWRLRLRGVKPHKGKALFFPGKKNNYVLGPRFHKFRGSFTISFFVKPLTVSRPQILIGQWSPRRWQYLLRLNKGGQLGLRLRQDVKKNPTKPLVPTVRGGKLVPNRWYYVGFSWDHPHGIARIYINGKVVGQKKTSSKIHNLFHNPYPQFQLGYKKDSNSEFFNGYMGHLRFTRGVLPVRRFKMITRRIKHYKLHFGGFKFTKQLFKSLVPRGILHLSWFRYGKRPRKKCIHGSRRFGNRKSGRCRIFNLRWVYRWIRRHAPKFQINTNKLPRIRHYPFAPGNKHMLLYPLYHSRGGKPLKGLFTSKRCRNWCQRNSCWAVDYNGANRRCYVHRHPRKRRPATAKSTGTKYYWKVAQYVKRSYRRPAYYRVRRYYRKRGNCRGQHLRTYHRISPKACAKRCNRIVQCRGFFYVERGSKSKCNLKRIGRRCVRKLRNRRRWNYNFYYKKAPRVLPFNIKLFRKNVRPNGVLQLKWFPKLKKCMWGTTKAGSGCKIVKIRKFYRWVHRYYRRYRIPLGKFPHITRLHHLFVFKKRQPKRFRLIRHGRVKYRTIKPKTKRLRVIDFSGKRGSYVTGPRFVKWHSSFSISLYIKPRTVKKRQTIIGQWKGGHWQYLLRIWEGGNVGLYVRGDVKRGSRNLIAPIRAGKVPANKWSHIGFTYNRLTGTVRVFLNGKNIATKKTNSKNHNLYRWPFHRFQLGYKMDSKSGFFNGLMANLKFTRGVLPNTAFVRYFKFIKNNKLNFSGFPYFKLLWKQIRPHGVIQLKWFKRKHCFPGTIKKGNNCIIRRIRFFIRWLRRTAPKFRINIQKLPVNKVWPLQPHGKFQGHPWYLLFLQPRPKKSRGVKRGKGPFGSKQPGWFFPGKPNGYFRIPNRNHLHFKSFTITAWIKQDRIRNGAIVEYRGKGGRGTGGTHFWIWQNTLYVNVVHNHGKSYSVAFPRFKGMFPKNKWSFVGVSYNHKNGHLVMWINGRTIFRKAPKFTPDTIGDVYVGIRPSNPRFHPFRGYLSAVSIFPFAITRKQVPVISRKFTIRIGGKAPPGFFKLYVKPKPKPKPKPSLRPAGKVFGHPYYDLFGFLPKKPNRPSKHSGPFNSPLPSYFFPGKPNKFYMAPSNGKLNFKSITIFTFLKQKKLQNGPIVEWPGAKGRPFGTHFWIWESQLWVNLVHSKGQNAAVKFTLKGSVPAKKWNFVGMSYNHKTGILIMWINGNTYRKKVGKFILDTLGDVYVGVRPRRKAEHPFHGYLSGTSLMPFAIDVPQFIPFRNAVIRDIFGIKGLPANFWWKVGYKPKPKPQPPKACTYTFENADCAGHDIHHTRQNRDACRKLCDGRADCKSFQQRGNNCWLKNHVCSKKELTQVGKRTFAQFTKTTCGGPPIRPKAKSVFDKTNLRPGGKFNLQGIFHGLGTCPKGSKYIGHGECEIVEYAIFQAWLKIHAVTYKINYSLLPLYTVTTTTTTFAAGQEFSIVMFRNVCPKGTTQVGQMCKITNLPDFMAWLKVNAVDYGISYTYTNEHGVTVHGGAPIGGGGTTTTTTTSAMMYSISMFPGQKCPTGTKQSGSNCEVTDQKTFDAWMKANGYSSGGGGGGSTTTTTVGGMMYSISMFPGKKCPTGSKQSGTNCEVTDQKAFDAWMKANGYSSGGGGSTTTTTTSGMMYNISMFPNKKCPTGTKQSGTNCEVKDQKAFDAWMKANGYSNAG